MTDKPIIFSAPMITALLAGTKTQTRRVAKITAVMGNKVSVTAPEERLIELDAGEFRRGICHYESTDALSGPYRLPYCVGDRLWAREAFATTGGGPVRYYATDDVHELRRKRSPIHMPRWASRLTLIVTDVRVQRLAEISEEDARAEGATSRPACNGFMSRYDGWSMDWSPVGTLSAYSMSAKPGGPAKVPLTESDISLYTAASAFANYWDTTHGPGSWTANPWVCALTFTVLRCNIDDAGA